MQSLRRRQGVFGLFSSMSKLSTGRRPGGQSVSRISRISSHLLSTSNRKNLEASFTSNAASDPSGVNKKPKIKASEKEQIIMVYKARLGKNFNYDEDDRGAPNESWTKESVDLFNKLKNEADASNGLWEKIPAKMPPQTGNRLFLRCLWDQEGKLFEYSMFMNKKQQCLKAIFQFGPYTEGPKGYVHGGAISTAMDSVIGICIHGSGYISLTANLSVDFKKGLPVGSTALLESRVDRVEGRKVFGYAEMKSPDGSITYATSTAIFIQFHGYEKKDVGNAPG